MNLFSLCELLVMLRSDPSSCNDNVGHLREFKEIASDDGIYLMKAFFQGLRF